MADDWIALKHWATPRQGEILDAIATNGGNQSQAARVLGLNIKTVQKRLAEVRRKRDADGAESQDAPQPAPLQPSPQPQIVVHESGTIARRIMVIPDVHVPYHCHSAWDTTVRAAHALQPDLLVIIGDFIDCYSVSQFSKDPKRRQILKDELDAANVELDRLKDAAGSYLFTVGNHEHRIERYIYDKAPALDGMISLPEYLRARERGITWAPYKDFVRVGKVAFTHEIGHAGKTAANLSLAAFGGNLVFGHTHRAATIYGGTVDGERHFCLNVGWLGDPNQVDYVHRSQMRDWQHGFGWIDQDGDGNSWAQFCPIVDGRVVVKGRVYS